VRKSGDRCASFRKGAKNKTSLQVNKENFYDYGDPNNRGDCIDLYANFHGISVDQAIGELASNLQIQGSVPQVLDNAARLFHSNLSDECRTYLANRMIAPELVTKHKIGTGTKTGFNPDDIRQNKLNRLFSMVVFPVIYGGRTYGFVGRSISKKEHFKTHREMPPWGMDAVSGGGPIFITDGIFDALSLQSSGLNAISITGGMPSLENIKLIASKFQHRQMIVVADYDHENNAGLKNAENLCDALLQEGIRPKLCIVPVAETSQDINSIHIETETVYSESVDYIDYRTGSFSPEDEELVVKFLGYCSHALDIPDLKKLGNQFKDVFDKDWINSIIRQITAPPSEDEVVKQLSLKYDLLFSEELGWFRYRNGCWVRQQESEIMRMIGKIYGKHRTGRLLNSTLKVAESELHCSEPLNPFRNMLNFQNGMLNVDTRSLVPHGQQF